MFNAEDVSERDLEPTLDKLKSGGRGVGRVGEGNVVRARGERGDKSQGILTVNVRTGMPAELFEIGLEDFQHAGRLLHEIARRGTEGKCLQAKRAAAGTQIQNFCVRKQRVHNAHPRFAYAIARGAHEVTFGRFYAPTFPTSGNNSHSASASNIGQLELES